MQIKLIVILHKNIDAPLFCAAVTREIQALDDDKATKKSQYKIDNDEADDSEFEEARTQALLAEQQLADQASKINMVIAFAKKLFKNKKNKPRNLLADSFAYECLAYMKLAMNEDSEALED